MDNNSWVSAEDGSAVSTEEEFFILRNSSTNQDAIKEKRLLSFWSAMASSYPSF